MSENTRFTPHHLIAKYVRGPRKGEEIAVPFEWELDPVLEDRERQIVAKLRVVLFWAVVFVSILLTAAIKI
jgi:hypothetical protein